MELAALIRTCATIEKTCAFNKIVKFQGRIESRSIVPYSNFIDNASKGGNVETTTSEGNTKEDAFDDENLSGKQRTESEATLEDVD